MLFLLLLFLCVFRMNSAFFLISVTFLPLFHLSFATIILQQVSVNVSFLYFNPPHVTLTFRAAPLSFVSIFVFPVSKSAFLVWSMSI